MQSGDEVGRLVLELLQQTCAQEDAPAVPPSVLKRLGEVAKSLWETELAFTEAPTAVPGAFMDINNLKHRIEQEKAGIQVAINLPTDISAEELVRRAKSNPEYAENSGSVEDAAAVLRSSKWFHEHRARMPLEREEKIESARRTLASSERYLREREFELARVLRFRRSPQCVETFVSSLTQCFFYFVLYIGERLPQSSQKTKAVKFYDLADEGLPALLTDLMRPINSVEFNTYIYFRLRLDVNNNCSQAREKYGDDWFHEYTTLSPQRMATAYYSKTALQKLFDIVIEFPEPEPEEPIVPEIEERAWYSHALLLAQSGSGKTNTIRWRIEQLLPLVAEGKQSLIVMEPQGDLIRDLLHLAKVYEMRDRLIILDPSDTSVSVNIFEKPSSNSPSAMNQTIEHVGRVLGTMATDLTPNQRDTLTFALRGMFTVAQPSMRTLMGILRAGKGAFPEGKLPTAVHDFFQYDFQPSDGRFILSRLNSMLANPIFEALFGEKTTFNLPKEIQGGKLIIINAGAAPTLYGKFWIEEVARCIQLRTQSQDSRTPCIFIIDEAQRFVADSEHFADTLNRGRAARIGMLIACHHMEQITNPHVRHSLYTNTALKFVARTSADIHNLCRSMGKTEPAFITTLPQYEFAFFGPSMEQAIKVKFPLVEFYQMPQMTASQHADMLHGNRRKYAAPIENGTSTTKQPTQREIHVLSFINNVPIRILVDTGATSVVLSLSDAAKVGIDTKKLSFSGVSGVVGGIVRHAKVVLASVRVDQIEVRNVSAVVIDTSESLLGQTFLSNLKSYHKEGDTFTMKGPGANTEGGTEWKE